MALARSTPRTRHRLLARLRRRAVDADPRHRVPALGVRDRAVLPVAGSHRQGHRAAAAQRAARPAHRNAVAGKGRQGQSRGHARLAARQSRAGRDRARPARRASTRGSRAAAAGRASLPAQLDAQKGVAVARAGAGRAAEPADRRAAPPACRARERRSKPPRARTRNRRRASPISASGSISRWRSACRSSRASARSSSAGCARSSATGPTSAWSATASCSSPKCSSMPGRPWSSRAAAPNSTSSRARSIELEKQIPTDVAWVLRVDGHTDVRPIASAAVSLELGAVRRARDLGGAVPDRPGHLAAAPGRRRLRRIPAARPAPDRGRLPPQPPHRAEADGAVIARRCHATRLETAASRAAHRGRRPPRAARACPARRCGR